MALKDGLVHYFFRPAPGPRVGPCLVLLGATAQTIHSLVGHHSALTTDRGPRALLQLELRGQGRTTTLPLTNCGMATQVDDMCQVLDNAGFAIGSDEQVDIVGYSFGGRVALAVAANAPERVRRLVVTGVPVDRGAAGRVILQAWKSSLQAGNLEAFLWQSMANGHSPEFLARHESKLAGWVASAGKANRAEAIAALVAQTHTDDIDDPWHTLRLARKAAPSFSPQVLMKCSPVRLADRLAGGTDGQTKHPAVQRQRLRAAGGWP